MSCKNESLCVTEGCGVTGTLLCSRCLNTFRDVVPHRRTFCVDLGSSTYATSCVIRELESRSWTSAPQSSAKFIWLPFSKTNFDTILPSSICGCHRVRTALVRKDSFVKTALLSGIKSMIIPKSILISHGDTPEIRKAALSAIEGPWAIKEPLTNNAQGVRFASDSDALEIAINAALTVSPHAAVVVQKYIINPHLYNKKKYHVRVNVLLLGHQWVYIHADAVAHIACEEWSYVKGDNLNDEKVLFQHLTNNLYQRQHKEYKREKHTLLLKDIFCIGSADFTKLFTNMSDQIHAIFNTVLNQQQQREKRHKLLPFLTLPSAFEIFGFDFLVTNDDMQPVILEINGGPALESAAWPDICQRVIKDTIDLVLLDSDDVSEDDSDSDSDSTGGVWRAAPIPSSTSNWKRIR